MHIEEWAFLSFPIAVLMLLEIIDKCFSNGAEKGTKRGQRKEKFFEQPFPKLSK